MTDTQLLRRFRDALETSDNSKLRGASLGLAITAVMDVSATETVEFLDAYCRLWREIRLEAQLT